MLKYRILVAAGALAGFGALAHAAANDPVAPPPQKVVAQATIPWMELSPGLVAAVAWDSSDPGSDGTVGVRVQVTTSIQGDTKVSLMGASPITARAIPLPAFPANLTQATLNSSGVPSVALSGANPLVSTAPAGWQDVFFRVSALRLAGFALVKGGVAQPLSLGLPLYKSVVAPALPTIQSGYWLVGTVVVAP